MVWGIASTMPFYAKIGAVRLVVLVGGYWMFQEFREAKRGCSCCLQECLLTLHMKPLSDSSPTMKVEYRRVLDSSLT